MTHRELTPREFRALQAFQDQRRWIEEHGGDLAGYIRRYGSKDDPARYGDGGEAIYEADREALGRAEALCAAFGLIGRDALPPIDLPAAAPASRKPRGDDEKEKECRSA